LHTNLFPELTRMGSCMESRRTVIRKFGIGVVVLALQVLLAATASNPPGGVADSDAAHRHLALVFFFFRPARIPASASRILSSVFRTSFR
jgi:hypothetical protein